MQFSKSFSRTLQANRKALPYMVLRDKFHVEHVSFTDAETLENEIQDVVSRRLSRNLANRVESIA